MNTIETTDFAELYKNHMQQAQRTKKEPEHWDKRAEKMAENCANPNDPYLIKFREMMDFSDAETLLDVGCGPGSISIHVADKFKKIIGIDYSTAEEHRAQMYLSCAIWRLIKSITSEFAHRRSVPLGPPAVYKR